MYKHVAKQRKLADSNKEAHLSDEESSGDESAQDLHSDAESGSEGSDDGSDDDDEVELDDEDLVGAVDESNGDDDEDDEDAEAEGPPPPGYPTAQEALENPIATPETAAGDEEAKEGEEVIINPVCVVCPSKALKAGKMLEVHLGSKDHQRRLTRFRKHIEDASFPSASLLLDARVIAAQLDKTVFNRLSDQTQFGGKNVAAPSTAASSSKLSTSAPAPTAAAVGAAPKPQLSEKAQAKRDAMDLIKRQAAEERRSIRSLLKEQKQLKNAKKRVARNEKKARLLASNGGEVKTGEAAVDPKQQEAKAKKGKAVELRKPKKKNLAPKPTAEEIAKRQAAKIAKREAAAKPGATPTEMEGTKPLSPKPKKETAALQTKEPTKEPTKRNARKAAGLPKVEKAEAEAKPETVEGGEKAAGGEKKRKNKRKAADV